MIELPSMKMYLFPLINMQKLQIVRGASPKISPGEQQKSWSQYAMALLVSLLGNVFQNLNCP